MASLTFWLPQATVAVDGFTLPAGLWRAIAVALGGALVSVVGFVGRAILKRMDDDKAERVKQRDADQADRSEVMKRVADVAAAHERQTLVMAERVEKVAEDHREQTRLLAEKVEGVATEHRTEIKAWYERIFGWNSNVTKGLADVDIRMGSMDTRLGRIEERLPARRARGSGR